VDEVALRYAHGSLASIVAVIKVLEGNVASLGVAHKLGAFESGRELSGAGREMVVLRVALGNEEA
jgi:hypothetical protein